MATTFTIADGTTQVPLNSGSTTVMTEYNQTQQDESGGSTDVSNGGSVSESMTILIVGSYSTIQSVLRGIERMIENARRRSSRLTGPRVFLTAQLEGDSSSWRSELYDGRLVTEGVADQLWRGKVEANFTFVRSRYWEGSETELSISSYGGGSGTGGRNILNNGVDNWIEVNSSQVDGAGPGLCRLRLQNLTGSNMSVYRVWMGNNAFSNPSSFPAYIQGESSISGGSVSGSEITATIDTTQLRRFVWRFSSAQMAANGRWFRAIARMPTVTTAMLVRLSIYDYYFTERLWKGGETLIDNSGASFKDLGSIPIPPSAYSTDYAQCTLVMEAWTATGTGTLSVDFIGLLGTDAFRYLHGSSLLIVANNDYIEVDDIEFKYHSIESSAKHPIFSPLGTPLMVFPGVTQRIHVLSNNSTSGLFKAQLWYRPARLTV